MAEGAVVAANRVGPRRRSDGVDLLWLGVRRPVDGVVVLEVIGVTAAVVGHSTNLAKLYR